MSERGPSAEPGSAASRPPLVVIIGPPWLRTGTGRVIEDQVAYYRDRGFATAFVGVPVGAEHGPENPLWLRQADAARELHADHVSFAILDAPQNPKTLSRRLRQLLAARTSLDWIVEIGNHSHPSQALLDYLRKKDVALLHVNHVFTLGFMRRLRAELGPSGRTLPVLVETHDVQSEILHDRQELNPWTGRPDSLQRLRRAELACLRQADLLVHCSVDDQCFFLEKFPDKPQLLARPSIHGSFVKAVRGAPEIAPIDILLVGTGHHANFEAVEWFLTEVWPLIAENGYKVRIVGGIRDLFQERRPVLHDRFRKLFVGRVADLAPYYRAARSVIAPMRSGGGISIKTIEAFALAAPFVGTAKAFRGFPQDALIRNGIHSHDDPQAFAGALLRILSGNDDDAGKRGRAVYDELFAEDKCYAARDEAVRIAREIAVSRTLRNGSSRRTSSQEETRTFDMEVLALGSSNCIGPTSFTEMTGRKLGVKLTNLSLGACSSTVGLYQLQGLRPARRGVAFIDFAINDNDTGYNLWGTEKAPQYVADNIRTIVTRLRSSNYLPIIVLSASQLDLGDEPFGDTMHRGICEAERINFIDVRRLVLEAIGRGASQTGLMRDDYHISERAADEVAAFLEAVVRRMDSAPAAHVRQSASILRSRVVPAQEMFPSSALVHRSSSLRSGSHGRLMPGDVVDIPMRSTERLRGLMINVAAKGGTIAVRGDGTEVIKSLTVYWDAASLDIFGSMMIDFAHPLPGGSGGLTIELVGSDVIPTEPTIHRKPIIPGRYGEIEIEGALLTELDQMTCDFTASSYDWLPTDLGELPEAQKLREGLARLR